MIKFMRSAVVVVACLFAGVGAWGAEVTVLGPHPYASELFGNDDVSPKYPGGDAPTVQLFIPANVADDAGTPDEDETVDHTGSAEITFRLHGGAVFNANVTALMFDSDGPPPANCGEEPSADGCAEPVVAPGGVASIVSGGRKGDSSITIKVEEAEADTSDSENNTTMRDMGDGTEGGVIKPSPLPCQGSRDCLVSVVPTPRSPRSTFGSPPRQGSSVAPLRTVSSSRRFPVPTRLFGLRR